MIAFKTDYLWKVKSCTVFNREKIKINVSLKEGKKNGRILM